jgi:hypothetical protein
MTILRLERVVIGGSVIAEQVELAGEVRPGRNIDVLSHQLASSGANIRQRQHVGIRDALLDCGVPLIRSRQHVVWIDHGHHRSRRARGKRRRSGST